MRLNNFDVCYLNIPTSQECLKEEMKNLIVKFPRFFMKYD